MIKETANKIITYSRLKWIVFLLGFLTGFIQSYSKEEIAGAVGYGFGRGIILVILVIIINWVMKGLKKLIHK